MKESASNKVTLLSLGTPYLPNLEHSLNQSGFDAQIIKCRDVAEIKEKALELYAQDKDNLLVFSDDEEFARILYSSLREADAQGLKEVVVIEPIGTGIAVAIRDRLARAANGR